MHMLDVNETTSESTRRATSGDYEHARRGVRNVVDREGRIDLLFIAAGVHLFATLEDTTIEEFERVMAISVNGTFYVLKEVLPVIRQQRYG